MTIKYKEVCASCKWLHEFCIECGRGFDKLNMILKGGLKENGKNN